MKYLMFLFVLSYSSISVAQTSNPRIEETPEETKIFTVVEQMPQYPGGNEAMVKFLQENIHYPQFEMDKKIEGRVVVGFVVNEDGSLSDINIKRRVSPGIDAEAIRVVSLMPPFRCGRQQGRAVKVNFVLPILFKLADEAVVEAVVQEAPVVEEPRVYKFVEQMPSFPGGEKELNAFIQRNMQYPTMERENDIQGRVYYKFVINEDGSLSELVLLRSVSPGLDKEARRLIMLFPRFKPGMQQGKPVKVEYTLPINFKLPIQEKEVAVSIREEPVIEEAPVVSESKVFKVVEQMPEFPGGDEALMKLIQKNMQYPEMEKANDIQGRVVMGFIVNEDGSLSDITVKKRVSPGIDKEAIRLIRMLPNFRPGRQQGKAVKVEYLLPIMFKIPTQEKEVVAMDVAVRTEPVIEAAPVVDGPKVFTVVEQMPQYPGGDEALVKFIQKNLQYPQMERDNDIQGRVLVKFIVNEDGSVSDAQVKRSISPGLDKEALRVINMLPRFIPGRQQGKAVKVYFLLPVAFKLAAQDPVKKQ